MSRARDTAEVAEEIDLKVDYSTPVNEQTGTSYTFQLADARKLTTASSASAVTLTIPPQSEVTWENDTILRIVNYGAGDVTVAGGSGVTVTNTATTLGQYESAAAIRTDSDAWTLVPFGGGEAGAVVSSPSATGSFTDGGVTYNYYKFTATTSVTFSSPGVVEVLCVSGGGGGGGGSNARGGGGGGGFRQGCVVVDATTYTATVGAGGSVDADGSASSLGSLFSSVGGGAGGNSLGDSGSTGGSGGGGAGSASGVSPGSGGAGTTTDGVFQGTSGGSGSSGNNPGGGGGGGANASGNNAGVNVGGAGGAGRGSTLDANSLNYYSGGGGGKGWGGANASGGTGGGGAGGTAGTANTGGGGGAGAAGGSGVIILKVPVIT